MLFTTIFFLTIFDHFESTYCAIWWWGYKKGRERAWIDFRARERKKNPITNLLKTSSFTQFPHHSSRHSSLRSPLLFIASFLFSPVNSSSHFHSSSTTIFIVLNGKKILPLLFFNVPVYSFSASTTTTKKPQKQKLKKKNKKNQRNIFSCVLRRHS